MSGRSRTLQIEILGDATNADKALQGIEKSADGLGSKLGTTAKIAGAALAGIGVAAGAVAVDSARAFVGFQNQMNEVFTLLPGISRDAMDQMTGQVLDFSREFGTLPEEVVPALYQSLSAGVPPDNVFSFLETAQKAAIGGVTELETAVDGISSVVNAYGSDVLGAAEASDLMFTAVRLGKTDFEQLSSSLFNVIPTAASLGVGFQDVTAALATLTAQGTPTSVATTQIRQALVEASKAGGDLDTALRDLTGKGFTELIAGGADIGSIFQDLRESMPEEEFRGLFGSVEAMNAVLGLTGPNAETFAKNLDEMGESAGATDGAFEQMDTGVQRSIDKIKANLAAMRLELGQRLLPVVETLTSFLLDKGVPALGALFDTMGDVASLLQGGDIAGAFERIREAIGGLAGAALEAVGQVDWTSVGSSILDALLASLESTADAGLRFVGWLTDQITGVDYAGLASALWDGVLAGLGAAADAGQRLIGWLAGTLAEVDYAGIAGAIWGGAISALGAVEDAGQQLVSWLVGTLGDVDWSGLGSTVANGLMTAVSAVQGFGQRVVAWIADQLGSADWGALRTSIENGLGSALESLQALGENEGLQSFISLLQDKLQPVLTVISDEIMPRLQPTIDRLSESFGEMSDTLDERAGPVLDQLKETGQALAPILQTLGVIVAGVLLAALSGLGNFLAEVLPPALNFSIALIEALLVVVETAAKTITNLVGLVKALIEGDWSEAWQNAKAIVTDLVGGIIEVVSGLGPALLGLIQGVVEGIIGFFQGLYDTLVGGSIVPDLINDIVSEFGRLILEVPAKLGEFVSSAIGFFSDLATEGLAKVSGLVRDILGEFGDLLIEGPLKLGDFAIQAVLKLFSFYTDGLAEIERFVGDALEDLVNWVTDAVTEIGTLPGRAIDALGDLGSTLLDAGRDLIQGLIDGIQEKIPSFNDVLGGITDSIPDLKGPAEKDKKLLRPAGQMIVQGLIDGVEESIDKLVEALKNLTRTLVDTVNSELVIPGPHESEEGYEAGQSFGTGVAIGVDDSKEDVARAGAGLGRSAVEGTEAGMAESAPGSLGRNAPPAQSGAAMGKDFGEGAAQGVMGTEAENYEAGERIGGAIGAGAQDGHDAAMEPYDPYKWYDPDAAYDKGHDAGEAASDGFQDGFDPQIPEEPQSGSPSGLFGDEPSGGSEDTGTPTSGGPGGTVGFSTGTASGGGADMSYVWNGITYGIGWGQATGTILNWLYGALDRGVTMIRVRNGTNIGGTAIPDGTHATTALIEIFNMAAEAGVAGPSVPQPVSPIVSGSSGPSSGNTPGITSSAAPINITVNAKSTNPQDIASEVEAAMQFAALDARLALVRS